MSLVKTAFAAAILALFVGAVLAGCVQNNPPTAADAAMEKKGDVAMETEAMHKTADAAPAKFG